MMKLIAAMLILGVAACSSETTGTTTTGCTDPTGNYKVKTTKVDGTCQTGDGESTVTISRVDGKLAVALPGLEGACPADLDAATCSLTAVCKAFDKAGATIATFNVDYTISGNNLSGTMAGALKTPAVPKDCTVNERHEGSKI